MSDVVRRIQARARELARSGEFVGWRALAFELQFEPGFSDAYGWLYSPSKNLKACAKRREHGDKSKSLNKSE